LIQTCLSCTSQAEQHLYGNYFKVIGPPVTRDEKGFIPVENWSPDEVEHWLIDDLHIKQEHAVKIKKEFSTYLKLEKGLSDVLLKAGIPSENVKTITLGILILKGTFYEYEDPKLYKILLIETGDNLDDVLVTARFITLMMSLMEDTREHWRRFSHYWDIFDFIITKCSHNERILLHKYFFFISRIVDYYMGSNSPHARRPFPRQPLKQDSTNRTQIMDMGSFMWAFTHMICAVNTDVTEKNLPSRPPTCLTDCELLSKNNLDAQLLFNKKLFVSMTKLSYNSESHAMLISHVCWEDKTRSLFVITVLQELYNHLDIQYYILYVRSLLTMNDSLSKWRISTLLSTRSKGLLFMADYFDKNDKERLAAIVVSLMDIMKKTPLLVAWFKRSDSGDKVFLNFFECILKQLRLFDSKAELIQKQINEITELKNEYLSIKKESPDFEWTQSDQESEIRIHTDQMIN